MSDDIVGEVIFKARLGNGPIQIVGEADVYEEDLDDGDWEEFLQNRASDWAYDAVHSDCLHYWAERKVDEN